MSEPIERRDGGLLGPRPLEELSARSRSLDRCELDVRPGEVVALLGENGAGKSTISNIIAGVFRPDAGQITWHGQPYAPAVARRGDRRRHRHDPPGAEAAARSVGRRERLCRPAADARRPDRPRRDERARGRPAERLGLNVSPDRKVRTLRVAAQQQVEIAKALALDAQLLIFDEPTAALGGEETELLFDQIRQLKAEGMSFVYISHRLEEIAAIADRIVVMRDGRIVARHDTRRTCRCAPSSSRWSAAASSGMFPDARAAAERGRCSRSTV